MLVIKANSEDIKHTFIERICFLHIVLSFQVAFEDILAEVPGAHAIDCVWRNSYRCFEGGKSCCYKFLTAICGICIALYWGCCFACLAFEHIWCVTPSLSAFRVECGAWRKYYSICMDCFCAPCCETMGLCFSNIKVQNK